MKPLTGFFWTLLVVTLTTVAWPQSTLADSVYEDYTFTTFAGPAEWATTSSWHDGVGVNARFNNPCGMVRDASGNIYLADRVNNTIRKMTPDGTVTTLAGLAGTSGSADGEGSAARFNGPNGVALDAAGNLYVADTGNNTIRKITPAGMVTTIAGLAGASGKVDATGSAARFNTPFDLTVSGTNLYVADTFNHAIRQVTPTGVVTTFAGSMGNSGSTDKTGTAARFNFPSAIALDTSGNFYVTEAGNDTLRKISPGAAVTTLAGLAGQAGSADGTNDIARFNTPLGVTVDADGTVYVADSSNDTIRKVTPAGVVSTPVGKAGVVGSADGIGDAARFNSPFGIVVDGNDNLFVADFGNNVIRQITPDAVVTTIAGLTGGPGAQDGNVSEARFKLPAGSAVDAGGNVYVADEGNQTIRKITPGGEVSTFAGTAGVSGTNDANGLAATFNHPVALAFDQNGNLFVADSFNNAIREITPAGDVSTFAGLAGGTNGVSNGVGTNAQFFRPLGIAVDSSNNVYVGDTLNHAIRKITPDGVVSTLAGTIGTEGTNNANGLSAGFSFPEGVAVDPDGNVYVVDNGDFTVRKITPAGDVTTLAGLSGVTGSADGVGTDARFNFPFGLTIDANRNLYVTDGANQLIRKIQPDGTVTTLGGSPGVSGDVDATGDQARFSGPEGIASDSEGNLYVADSNNDSIRKGSVALPDRPTIDLSAAPVGIIRQLGVANSTGTSRNWSFLRYPSASSAQLSSTNAVNPTFTPDVEDIYILRFTASDDSGHSAIRTLTIIADSTPPTLAITNPVAGQVSSNGVFAVSGTASDNLGLSNIWVQLNGGAWTNAVGTNAWSLALALTPGTNVIRAYAQDLAGNVSPTNEVDLLYVLSAPLTVQINGGGSVTPNLNGVLLAIGNTYSMTAQAGKGSAFVNWTEDGDIITNSPTLTFVMQSNLTFVANFTDPIAPTLAITFPKNRGNVSNAVFTATGTASDNGQLAAVWYQLNGGGWLQATNTSNWTAGLAPVAGANTLQAYAVDTFTNISTTNSVNFTYIPSSQMTVSFTGRGALVPNYNGALLQNGKNFTITAKPDIGYIFYSWVDSAGNTLTRTPAVTFLVQTNTSLRANFILNPFAPFLGPLAGLFYETNNVGVTNSGFVSLTLGGFGGFSAKLSLAAGNTASFSGQFSADGVYSNSVAVKGSTPFVVQLQLDAPNGRIIGSVGSSSWTVPLVAIRAFFSPANPAPESNKKYTLVIPGGDDSSLQPGGNGYGTVSISVSGNVSFSGVLGDGTKISQKTFISKQSQWPFYAAPYKGQGVALGWMTFTTNDANSDLSGMINWIRQPQAGGKLYPGGFNFPNGIPAVGSLYSSAKGMPVLNLPAGGAVVLQQGNLSQSFTNQFTLGANNKVTSADGLSLTITTASGVFKGAARNPGNGSSVPINGVLLQKQNTAYGFFLGTNQSGAVFLGQ